MKCKNCGHEKEYHLNQFDSTLPLCFCRHKNSKGHDDCYCTAFTSNKKEEK